MAQEPSVLDYLKSKLTPWKGTPLRIPAPEPPGKPPEPPEKPREPTEPPAAAPARPVPWPWRAFLALLLALVAQMSLEPPSRAGTTGALLYVLAGCWLVWSTLKGEWVAHDPPGEQERPDSFGVRLYPLLIGVTLAGLSFLASSGNRFTLLSVSLCLAGLVLVVSAFWQSDPTRQPWLIRLRQFISRPQWNVAITRWSLLFAGLLLLAAFFRLYQLAQVPPEMISDHAEKLLDISDVLNGQTSIFFPRNAGREAIQMYLSAALIRWLGMGLNFITLKIGMAICGLLALPYVYLLGREVGGRRAGLLAMAFTGIAYWPNVLARSAMRLTLYPLFVAPTLCYLLRGLRTRNRNDFVLSGVFLGFGLYGYTAFRVVPPLVVVAVLLYLLHHLRSGVQLQARRAVWVLVIVALVSLVIFMPQLRYVQENPGAFLFRTVTRMGTAERPLPGPALQIFLSNLWNALRMFSWDDGQVWAMSVTGRPALDVASSALFHIGVLLLLVRYIRRRNWLDLFLLLSIPILMLPSILSLAFPAENPHLSRTGGALIPTFVIVGLALDGMMTALTNGLASIRRTGLAWALAGILFLWSCVLNYDLVFNQYERQYALSVWNTSELGRVIHGFTESIGSIDTAWVVPYPYWVDTRLVGVNAGYSIRDLALWPDGFQGTLADPRAKLFLLHPDDTANLEMLRQLYPDGNVQPYTSSIEGKNFVIFFVPPQE